MKRLKTLVIICCIIGAILIGFYILDFFINFTYTDCSGEEYFFEKEELLKSESRGYFNALNGKIVGYHRISCFVDTYYVVIGIKIPVLPWIFNKYLDYYNKNCSGCLYSQEFGFMMHGSVSKYPNKGGSCDIGAFIKCEDEVSFQIKNAILETEDSSNYLNIELLNNGTTQITGFEMSLFNNKGEELKVNISDSLLPNQGKKFRMELPKTIDPLSYKNCGYAFCGIYVKPIIIHVQEDSFVVKSGEIIPESCEIKCELGTNRISFEKIN